MIGSDDCRHAPAHCRVVIRLAERAHWKILIYRLFRSGGFARRLNSAGAADEVAQHVHVSMKAFRSALLRSCCRMAIAVITKVAERNEPEVEVAAKIRRGRRKQHCFGHGGQLGGIMRSTALHSRITGGLPVRDPGHCSVVPLPTMICCPGIRLLAVLSAIAMISLNTGRCPADQLEELARKAGVRILASGQSSNDLQKQTAATVPLSVLTPQNRARAQKILDNCSQYRRLPSLQYSIDEPIFRYLMQHPDVAVSTWRVMGISRFEMLQTGPQEFEAKAVDGSEGIADILYQDQNQMLFICDGNYHNVLLPRPLQAAALIWFQAAYAPNAEGTQVVTQKVDVFVRFPSVGVSTVAKLLSPVTNGMMDRNLFEISLYGSMMSRAVRDEPEWIVQVAQQLEGVLPQRKAELIAVARQPRRANPRGAERYLSVDSVDRSIIMSPQLLFFDPPKDESAVTTAMGPRSTVPALSVSSAAELNGTAQKDQSKTQSDDEFELQPAVPPAGPTATGPVGSGPAEPGGR